MRHARRLSPLLLAVLCAAGCGYTGNGGSTIHVRQVVTPSPRQTRLDLGERPAGNATLGPAPTASPAGPTPGLSLAPDAPHGSVGFSGYVYDEDGALLGGASVTATSLDARVRYQASTTTVSGSYHFEGVPAGVNIQLVASAPGWTSRTIVRSFDPNAGSARIGFGSPPGSLDEDGAPYFLSRRPEIVRAEPAADANDVSTALASVRLTLNTPLDATHQARLVRALRLLPANDAANAGRAASTTDLLGLAGSAYPRLVAVDGNTLVAPYAMRAGSTFMQDERQVASASWDAAGLTMTLVLAGPLQPGASQAAAYQLALVSAGPDQPIRDTYGDVLGTDEQGRDDGYPPAGCLVPAVFHRAGGFAGSPGLTGGAWRWAATHADASRFTLAHDAGGHGPLLQRVHVVTLDGNTRLSLTFDEPLAAFDGTAAGMTDASVAGSAEALSHVTLALGAAARDLDGLDLGRGGATLVDPRALARYGADAELARPFRFDPAAFAPSLASAGLGCVVPAVDPTDAHTLTLTLVGRPDFFDPRALLLAARASGLADPAGRRTADGLADQHQVRTPL